jgi:acetyl esterase/lipase
MKRVILLLLTILIGSNTFAQKIFPLYSESMPNNEGNKINKDMPSIEVYLPKPEKSTRMSILIIPGGAYGFLAYQEEGIDVAKEFAKNGITSFVLRYRLPTDKTMKDKTLGSLQDAQKAIKMIRMRAMEWDLDSEKVGVIGYSAGGHLASMLSTKFHESYIENIEKINLRPDFLILVYPLISMDQKLTHAPSRYNLLGQNPTENQIWTFSGDKQVSFDTPPTYLTHAEDDQVVTVENSIIMYKALINNNVSAELHLFPKGDHGFTQRMPVNEWLDPMLLWLKKGGFYNKPISK